MSVYTFLLIIHVICGFTSLVAGAIAMLVSKNYKWHKLSGNVYYYGMIGVFVTVVPMYLIKGNALLFLLLIGFFSVYLVLSGKRFLSLQNRAKNIRWYDGAVAWSVLMISFGMVGLGLYDQVVGRVGYGIIVLVFGLILMSNSGKDVRFLKRVRNNVKGLRKPLLNHVGRMGGAYISTFTAFMVNNFSAALPYNMAWFLPGVIGSILITLTIKRLKRKSVKKAVGREDSGLQAA